MVIVITKVFLNVPLMALQLTNFVVLLCVSAVFATTLSAQSAADAESFLVNAEQRIHSDDFSIKDSKALELLQLPAAESGRRAMLLARFRHHACGDTQGALELLVGFIWPRESPTWIKAQRSARQLAVAAWEKEHAEAQRQQRDVPAPPRSVLVPALALLQSQVDAASAEAVLEFARLLLLSSHRSDECGLMVDRVLELPESLVTALALELGAELKADNSDLEGAVYLCDLALDRLRRLSQSSGSAQHRSPTEREGLLARRIAGARDSYQKRLDIERYGPGFVRYRDAERVRLSNGDMAVASGLYDAILRDFPNTIWAEVAGCYRVKCLIALADERNQVRLADAAKGSQQRVEADKERLKELRQRGAPIAAERRLREQLAEAEQESSRLFALPRGLTAGNIAEREDHFANAWANAYKQIGKSAEWEFLHLAWSKGGEVHCSSNAIRTPPLKDPKIK